MPKIVRCTSFAPLVLGLRDEAADVVVMTDEARDVDGVAGCRQHHDLGELRAEQVQFRVAREDVHLRVVIVRGIQVFYRARDSSSRRRVVGVRIGVRVALGHDDRKVERGRAPGRDRGEVFHERDVELLVRDELARERRLERRGRAEEDGADDLVVAREHIATREFTRRPSVSSLGVPNPNSDHPRRPRPQRDTSARVTSKPMRYLGRARSRARVPSPPRLLGLSTRHPRHRRDSPARQKGHIRLRRRARNAAKRTEPTHRVRRSRVRDTSIAVTRHTRPTLIMDRNAKCTHDPP